jgi:hypothetical protein
MTPQDLRVLNQRIHQYFLSNPRSRLLIHALDLSLLNDDEFQEIGNSHLPEDQLLDCPWVLALFWGRLFYKKSDGNNYRKIIRDALSIRSPDSLFSRIHTTCGWFPADSTLLCRRTHRFQAECWMTGFEGETSNLWRSLPRFIRRADSIATDDQICALEGAEEEDVTPPLRWLAREKDQDFCRTLRWLCEGGGASAVGRLIADNKIHAQTKRKDDFNAAFGLAWMGNQPEFALRVSGVWFGDYDDTSTRQLTITQGRKTLFSARIGRSSPSIIVSISELRPGFEPSQTFVIRLGNRCLDSVEINPIPWESRHLLLFRDSADRSFSRYIPTSEAENPPHIQGRHFFILGRTGENATPLLHFGDSRDCLSLERCGEIYNGIIARALYQLDIGSLREDINELREKDGTSALAFIGRKPHLELPSDSGVRLPGGDNTRVFVGLNKLYVKAENFVGEKLSVTVRNLHSDTLASRGVPNDPMSAVFDIGPAAWGQKWTVSACSEVSGDHASCDVFFLPGLTAEGVSWTPGSDDSAASNATAISSGLESGSLSFMGNEVDLLLPISEPKWAWSLRGWGLQEDYCTPKEFADHDQASAWSIEYALPARGGWKLKFNEDVISERSGRISLRQVVADFVRPEHLVGDGVLQTDNIRFIAEQDTGFVCNVASVWRFPSHPVLGTSHGASFVYIPDKFQLCGWRLLLIRETALLTDDVDPLDLGNFPHANVHQIKDLPPLKANEAAWLVLIDCGSLSNLPIEKITTFAACLPFITVSNVCCISPEAQEQGLLTLLRSWSEPKAFSDDEAKVVRSRLDLLEGCLSRSSNSQLAEKLFRRSRRQRRAISHTSHQVLKAYFEEQVLPALERGPESVAELLQLLFECGLNWLAEPSWVEHSLSWVETLPQFVRTLLLPRRKRLSAAMKRTLQDACPLTVAFDHIHGGACENIRLINPALLRQRTNQPQIGLCIACPVSEVEAFRAGFPFRGLSAAGMSLGESRRVDWPASYSMPVRIMDTHGAYNSIILKVADAAMAANFLADLNVSRGGLLLEEPMKERLRRLFYESINSSQTLIGSVSERNLHETELSILFVELCNACENADSEDLVQGSRAVIYQIAVVTRLHAWLGIQHIARQTPLSDSTAYDFVSQLLASVWSSVSLRKTLEKDIALVEWLITWFKNPNFHSSTL